MKMKAALLLLSVCLVLIAAAYAEESVQETQVTPIQIVNDLPDALSMDELYQLNHHQVQVRHEAGSGRVKEIVGCHSPIPILNAQDAVRSLASLRDIMGINTFEFALLDEDHSRDGYVVYTVQQLYQGIEVFGAILHVYATTDGLADGVNGIYRANIELDIYPKIDEKTARKSVDLRLGEKITSVRLSIYTDANCAPCLCWRYTVSSADILACRDVYVDASSRECVSIVMISIS